MTRIWSHLADNLWAGMKTSPFRRWRLTLVFTVAYAIPAVTLAWCFGLIEPGMVDAKWFLILPVSLFVFPSFLEEAFFRGVLIPRNTRELGPAKIIFYTLLSTILFVVWHPLNAMTINATARPFFLDPVFLGIVFLLGLCCSLSYIYSRSLWTATIIHWLTVLIWVLFLGGRNLVLE